MDVITSLVLYPSVGVACGLIGAKLMNSYRRNGYVLRGLQRMYEEGTLPFEPTRSTMRAGMREHGITQKQVLDREGIRLIRLIDMWSGAQPLRRATSPSPRAGPER
ncbi:MAG: hypothetical protein OXR66_03835 [Candidatus Woesearchaeota archaeon]|nr:hypothetical protein [Candidatus Woesearchaeota archaeon]